MASKLRKRRVMAFKTEGTPGTAESLVASDGAINCYDVDYPELDFGTEEREEQGSFNRQAATDGPKLINFRFRTEIVGSGDGSLVNAVLAQIIKACGYTQSTGTFTPTADPASMTTLTIGDYTDGARRVGIGCVGNLSAIFTNGRRGWFEFNFTGKYGAETDTSLITPTFPTSPKAPRGLASLSINSVTNLQIANMTLETGNTLHMLEDLIADTNTTGYAHGLITDRISKGSIDPASLAVATVNWDSLITTPTEFALSAVVGSASQNTITFAAVGSKGNVMSRRYGDRNGLLVDQIGLNLNRGFTIVFS